MRPGTVGTIDTIPDHQIKSGTVNLKNFTINYWRGDATSGQKQIIESHNKFFFFSLTSLHVYNQMSLKLMPINVITPKLEKKCQLINYKEHIHIL